MNAITARKIILDCDPGHDDAIAILLAAGSPAIDLLAITTVAGNHSLDNVTRNAQAVCHIAGINVPIARGADRPLVTPQIVSEDIHGDSGMDGPVLPEVTGQVDPRHAVDLIIDTVMAHEPGTVTLVPTGPLTNIALAMRKAPEIVARVQQIVLMGGSYTRGNVTPAAEYNIYVDPEAAEAVFRGDWEVVMVGLDLTHQALATDALQQRVRQAGADTGERGQKVAQFMLDIWEFFGQTYRDVFDFEAPPVHDACCVAMLIDPDLVRTELAHVSVELHGEWTKGQTVVNFATKPGMRHSTGVAQRMTDTRTLVATELNWERFAALIVESVHQLSAEPASAGSSHASSANPEDIDAGHDPEQQS